MTVQDKKNNNGSKPNQWHGLAKYSYPITILAMIIIMALFFIFLYKNVYITIIKAQEVTDLKQKVLKEEIKHNDFKKVQDNLNAKINTAATIATTTIDGKSPFHFSTSTK